jgi:hypothetical protein
LSTLSQVVITSKKQVRGFYPSLNNFTTFLSSLQLADTECDEASDCPQEADFSLVKDESYISDDTSLDLQECGIEEKIDEGDIVDLINQENEGDVVDLTHHDSENLIHDEENFHTEEY